MNITEATKEGTGDAESNAQLERDEDYNTRYASYRGYVAAFERTKPIPRRVADLNLTAMVAAARASTARGGGRSFRPAVPERAARRRKIAACSSSFCAARRTTSESDTARVAVSGAEHAGVSGGIDGARRLGTRSSGAGRERGQFEPR